MKSPPTIGNRSLTHLVQVYTSLLDEVAAGRPDKVAALKREAAELLERALYQLAGRLRRNRLDRDQLADLLVEVRYNTRQAVADNITIQRPELKQLLCIITDPSSPRA